MIWELTQDTFDDHSLLKVIQAELAELAERAEL
jgi:hypothetical protein